VGRWARSVAVLSAASVAYVWGASGDPGEAAAIGVPIGLLLGSFLHVEGHSEALAGPVAPLLLKVAAGVGVLAAGGVLASALDLEPNSGARLTVMGVALLLAVVLIGVWNGVAERRQRESG
jgi:hypothetical protein